MIVENSTYSRLTYDNNYYSHYTGLDYSDVCISGLEDETQYYHDLYIETGKKLDEMIKQANEFLSFLRNEGRLGKNTLPEEETKFRILSFPWVSCGDLLMNIKLEKDLIIS